MTYKCIQKRQNDIQVYTKKTKWHTSIYKKDKMAYKYIQKRLQKMTYKRIQKRQNDIQVYTKITK